MFFGAEYLAIQLGEAEILDWFDHWFDQNRVVHLTCSKLAYIRDHIIKTKDLSLFKNIIFIETISLHSMVPKIFHLLSISIWTSRFWSSLWSNQSKFSASPSWMAKYFVSKVGWLWPTYPDILIQRIGSVWILLKF